MAARRADVRARAGWIIGEASAGGNSPSRVLASVKMNRRFERR